jgi:uncharacterized protein (DUF2225 family)
MICPCNHVFCTNCLRQWMKQKTECPVCRATLPLEEIDLEAARIAEEDAIV